MITKCFTKNQSWKWRASLFSKSWRPSSSPTCCYASPNYSTLQQDVLSGTSIKMRTPSKNSNLVKQWSASWWSTLIPSWSLLFNKVSFCTSTYHHKSNWRSTSAFWELFISSSSVLECLNCFALSNRHWRREVAFWKQKTNK